MFSESNLRISLEVRSLQGAADIAEFFRVADPILDVDWGDDGVPVGYTPEYIVAHPDQTQIFAVRDIQTTEILAGAKVTVMDSNMANRLQLSEQMKQRKGVLFEYTFIKESLRDQGTMDVLMSQRMEWAKKQEAIYVCTELGVDDPRAIWVKLRKSDNFVLIGVCPPGEGIETSYFVAARPVDIVPEDQWARLGLQQPTDLRDSTVDPVSYEWDELPLGSSFEMLQKKFDEGWYGVDLRGTIDQDTESSVPWSIVFERQK